MLASLTRATAWRAASWRAASSWCRSTAARGSSSTRIPRSRSMGRRTWWQSWERYLRPAVHGSLAAATEDSRDTGFQRPYERRPSRAPSRLCGLGRPSRGGARVSKRYFTRRGRFPAELLPYRLLDEVLPLTGLSLQSVLVQANEGGGSVCATAACEATRGASMTLTVTVSTRRCASAWALRSPDTIGERRAYPVCPGRSA